MENSYDEECFKKWEINECEAEMEKVVQWIGKRKMSNNRKRDVRKGAKHGF